ncbi:MULTISPECIES: ATP-dependent Clp protease ATP-binding subunit [Halomonadaceae]|jgi:ATP-dependent Clp protease ATP-binding subunit ClpC|uniref:Negative regulator of genetic competence ClpC/MecB n=1 Tax=Vreelandella titanicae TaxID=664683 RepID=A0A653QE94_9GAMM|nr:MULTISPECIES: ATP-dependent Clp protease ATP-binding subunit [Halomonas]QKS23177.1 Negative regulator of genetic competence ClpC/MecB [Halomonas titanicae]CAD5261746.1 Chaperone protein ClpB [Halomonas sp. 156]CAD5287254.1 Chaperone protein ClpB [Halomonas sp. 113]CAD5288783.1 Chaperone protein ClpB [Halomonas sp. 59]CAD5291769.1 Chaperone protein ClpB [Halomonas sp. I3]|eukprot:TRINITY_DN8302_c0_g1_i2.p1 TRINITY_DN8302_c0_g1~~TRINITY_DN8302_c0_g1_i2.p1  ORF type:complete len:913 (+),score=152.57 TRINITY_DN8302_c0_g1_i2:102-2840(+)
MGKSAEQSPQVSCDICRQRPAALQVTVSQAGRRRTLNVCQTDYLRLRARSASPFESLFGSGLLADDFFERLARDENFGFGSVASRENGRPQDSESVALGDLLSEQSEQILQQAAATATEWGSQLIDTSHLLYALADNDVVQALLKRYQLSAKELKAQIEQLTPKAASEPETDGPTKIGVSPRVKAALQRAFQASRDLGHGYIGPEHLLIGLAEEEGLASDLLNRYGLSAHGLRQKAVQVVGKGAQEGRLPEQSDTPTLDKYSRDLTALANEDKLDPVIGRAAEVETLIEVLSRRRKNNPVLIGEPGVGKTAIVEGLAQRIVHNEVPDLLQNKRVVELNINSLVAGSQYRGQFEERIKQVLDEITSHQNEIVLFIDELHTIVGAGSTGGESGLDVANTLKPQLARGELHLVGATTLGEYQKHIEKDAALERRLQPVFVAEPTIEQTINILRGLRDRLEAHHKVTITDEAIVAAVEMADRYVTNRFLPDKAIDLIDQAAARVRIGGTSRPPELHELGAQIDQLRRERDYASNRKNFERASALEARIEEHQGDYDQGLEEWNTTRSTSANQVGVEDVAQIVSRLTGVPVAELTTEERTRLMEMEQRLHQRVVGQGEAVRAVSDAVRLSRAGLGDRRRPIATFFFLGPTGVGKTELTKALAETVFGDEEAMIRIDMSEYMERHTVARLIGAPPGYVGFEEGGQLTEKVRRKPYSVVLLDEFEKAHMDVQNVLLQVFDDGRLTDGKGRVVDFTNTIIIATSNIGSDVIRENLEAPEDERKDAAELKSELLNVLRRYLRPEFINRIDEIIVFHALDRKQIRDIVGLQLERVKRIAHGQGLTVEFDDSLIDHLADIGYRPEFGARELRRQIRSLIETRLASAVLRGEIEEGDSLRFVYDKGRSEVRWEKETRVPASEPE